MPESALFSASASLAAESRRVFDSLESGGIGTWADCITSSGSSTSICPSQQAFPERGRRFSSVVTWPTWAGIPMLRTFTLTPFLLLVR